MDDDGQVRYFEPAVLAAPNDAGSRTQIEIVGALFRQRRRRSGKRHRLSARRNAANARWCSSSRTISVSPPGRPGNVIDFFSRTGLFIVGVKVLRMSTAQAMEFYGPVREFLRTKLKDGVSAKAKDILEKEFGFKIPTAEQKALGEILGPIAGRHPVRQHRPLHVRPCARRNSAKQTGNKPGTEKCIALVYEGVEAVRKIRDVLGPTDPSKAPPGSIRREFGSTIMVNAAHASDSAGKRPARIRHRQARRKQLQAGHRGSLRKSLIFPLEPAGFECF